MDILNIKDLNKKYKNGNNEFYALKNININIKKGQFVSIIGKSGSGKSTLIHLIGGLDKPDSGTILINNTDINKMKDNDLTIFRRKNIGIIYQFYNLIPVLNVKENILLPALFDNRKISEKKLNELIKTLDLSTKENILPNDLSGGQQQRVSIGRALINRPKLLLADEPTGNLDSKNTKKIMRLLKYYNKKYKQTIIMVTHDISLAQNTNRIITMSDGKIIKDIVNDKF